MKKLTLILLSSFFALGSAYATEIPVASYSMNNGAAGSYDYRDFTYVPCNGVCDVTNAPLSGGTGKLTDGVLPSTDWDQEGYNTQWVGWDIYQGGTNPTATFFFGSTVNVRSVTIWLDNTAGRGMEFLPESVTIAGQNFLIPPDYVDGPRAYTFDVNITSDNVPVQFFQTPGYNWIMVGEVSFNDAVPEPATLSLAGAGMLAAWWKRRAARS